MAERLEALQARLDGLARELKEIRKRLETLEEWSAVHHGTPAGAPTDQTSPAESAEETLQPEVHEPAISAAAVPLVGRTLMVLAGAYLIRAITPTTEVPTVPVLGGAAAGLAYGAAWLVQADRAAARGQRLSAIFHGVASAMITYPLIWETTTRFGLLPAKGAALALVGLFALGLAVAWRRDLGEIAWVVTLSTLVAVTSLLIGTRDLMPCATALLVLAVAVELVAVRDRWLGLRWPVALAIDVAVLLMVIIAVRPSGFPEGYVAFSSRGVVMLGLSLPALYLASIAARSLFHERPITAFEVTQAAVALLVGLGGAVRVIASSGGDPTPVGIVSLLIGLACYVVAFAFVDRRSGRGKNFYSYTTFAVLLTLVGGYMVLGRSWLALSWGGLAIAAVSLGGRFDRITLNFHGAIYLGAAGVVAGLGTCTFDGLFSDSTGVWRPMTSLCSAIAFTAASCYGVLVFTGRRREYRWYDLLPQAIVAAAVVWISAGMAARWLVGALAGAPGPAADQAFVAAGRTAVLAVAAVALAWTGRRWSLRELTWLVYPLLVGGGIRLLLEDLRLGRPVTLFFTLALYGGALVITPRLLRKDP